MPELEEEVTTEKETILYVHTWFELHFGAFSIF